MAKVNVNIMVSQEESVSAKNGKKYKNYRVYGMVRGREIKMNLVPKQDNKGGYDNADLVFNGEEEAELLIETNEMTNDKGVTSQYTSYSLVSYDEDGTALTCPVKPQGQSDKSQLEYLVSKMLKGASQN